MSSPPAGGSYRIAAFTRNHRFHPGHPRPTSDASARPRGTTCWIAWSSRASGRVPEWCLQSHVKGGERKEVTVVCEWRRLAAWSFRRLLVQLTFKLVHRCFWQPAPECGHFFDAFLQTADHNVWRMARLKVIQDEQALTFDMFIGHV